MATGHLVAKWLQLNANEVFAVRSFLGRLREEKGKDVPWSENPLPTSDPKEEALVLSDLLAQFRVSAGGMSEAKFPDWEIAARPWATARVAPHSRWTSRIAGTTEAPKPVSVRPRRLASPAAILCCRLPEPAHIRLVVDLERARCDNWMSRS